VKLGSSAVKLLFIRVKPPKLVYRSKFNLCSWCGDWTPKELP